MMSLQERIKYYQSLSANKGQTKTLPQPPPPKTLTQKTQPKPTTFSETSSIKPTKLQIKPQVQLPNEPINPPPQKQLPKSAQVISQPKPPIVVHQSPKYQNQTNKNPEKNAEKVIEKEENYVMSVKERLKLFEQNKFPVVQQPPVMKSCFIQTKKQTIQGKTQSQKDKEQIKQQQKRVSMPEKIEPNQGQKKLTFQEMRLIAESLFNRAPAPPKPKIQETQEGQSKKLQDNHQNQQPTHEQNFNKIKVDLEQQTQKLEEDVNNQTKEVTKNKAETESDILFKQALKQQSEPRLVTGKQGNLTLGVRKTIARRRNNDDFDDL